MLFADPTFIIFVLLQSVKAQDLLFPYRNGFTGTILIYNQSKPLTGPYLPAPPVLPTCIHFGPPLQDKYANYIMGCHGGWSKCPDEYECYSSAYEVSGCCIKYARSDSPICPRGVLLRYSHSSVYVSCKSSINCPAGYECLQSLASQAPFESVCCSSLQSNLNPKPACFANREPLEDSPGKRRICSTTRTDTFLCDRGYTCTSFGLLMHCCPTKSIICDQMLQNGHNCDDMRPWVQRYYYNRFAGSCIAFPYYGCGGNYNNFESPLECVTVCNVTSEVPTNTYPPGERMVDFGRG